MLTPEPICLTSPFDEVARVAQSRRRVKSFPPATWLDNGQLIHLLGHATHYSHSIVPGGLDVMS